MDTQQGSTTFTGTERTMINVLKKLLPDIKQVLDDQDGWDSLVINKRKPHTYRVFRMFDDYRVCLHEFDTCDPDECFAHPHPWPGAFLMLKGEYLHKIGYSADLKINPVFFYEEIIRPYTMYQITNRHTWHSVQPLKKSFTVMVNGKLWKDAHSQTRTTKGKDLEKMNPIDLNNTLNRFSLYLSEYLSEYG